MQVAALSAELESAGARGYLGCEEWLGYFVTVLEYVFYDRWLRQSFIEHILMANNVLQHVSKL